MAKKDFTAAAIWGALAGASAGILSGSVTDGIKYGAFTFGAVAIITRGGTIVSGLWFDTLNAMSKAADFVTGKNDHIKGKRATSATIERFESRNKKRKVTRTERRLMNDMNKKFGIETLKKETLQTLKQNYKTSNKISDAFPQNTTLQAPEKNETRNNKVKKQEKNYLIGLLTRTESFKDAQERFFVKRDIHKENAKCASQSNQIIFDTLEQNMEEAMISWANGKKKRTEAFKSYKEHLQRDMEDLYSIASDEKDRADRFVKKFDTSCEQVHRTQSVLERFVNHLESSDPDLVASKQEDINSALAFSAAEYEMNHERNKRQNKEQEQTQQDDAKKTVEVKFAPDVDVSKYGKVPYRFTPPQMSL